ncbi:MAG TPA: hypothetical protein P5121_00255 [Caldilineaceae bacterium]|nr:hypothetical protein [Caldilineaceae bacterium]
MLKHSIFFIFTITVFIAGLYLWSNESVQAHWSEALTGNISWSQNIRKATEAASDHQTPHPTDDSHHTPQPSMMPHPTDDHHTPQPTETHHPEPTGTPSADDHTPPNGNILINTGSTSTVDSHVMFGLNASDNPGGTGVAWMHIREWGWDHSHGWHDAHDDGGHGDDRFDNDHGGPGHECGWRAFTPSLAWNLSTTPGIKYVTVWFADAAWNVGPPTTAMINLVPNEAAVDAGGIHQYRHFLTAGQSVTATVHSQQGDADLHIWQPGSNGQPQWWSNASAGDDQVTFIAPADGVYLSEVHGYNDAIYDLSVITNNFAQNNQATIPEAALAQVKPLPATALVVNAPGTNTTPLAGFQSYLPIIQHNP